MTKLTNLTNLEQTLSTWSSLSCNFFVYSIPNLLYQTVRHPFFVPTRGGARRDALRLGFGDEGFGFELIGKEGEEDLLLVKGFDGRKGDTLGAFDELVGLRHMEDELVANELGSSIVGVGTE